MTVFENVYKAFWDAENQKRAQETERLVRASESLGRFVNEHVSHSSLIAEKSVRFQHRPNELRLIRGDKVCVVTVSAESQTLIVDGEYCGPAAIIPEYSKRADEAAALAILKALDII